MSIWGKHVDDWFTRRWIERSDRPAQDDLPPQAPLTPKRLLVIGALTLLAVGVTIGFLPVKSDGFDCGSAFIQDSGLGVQEFTDVLGGGLRRNECDEARSSLQPFAWGLVVAGVVVGLAAGRVTDGEPETSGGESGTTR